MAKAVSQLCRPAQHALAARLGETVAIDGKGYCAQPRENLIETVTEDLWAAAEADLGGGKGSELESKFRASYSSSALAVNSFAPLRGMVPLPDGRVVEGTVRFEQERSAGTQGFKPTLDVIVEQEGESVRLFVESKCIEYLRKSTTSFSSAFVAKAKQHLRPASATIFEQVFEDPHAFDPLDAPQLLKHFLAAKRVAVDSSSHVVLLCVWWEPSNAAEHPVFAGHAAAARDLAAGLDEPDVDLLPLSYPQLWDHWRTREPWLAEHVACLERRYAVPVTL